MPEPPHSFYKNNLKQMCQPWEPMRMFAHSGVEACGRFRCHPVLVASCLCAMQSTDSVQFQFWHSYQDRHLLVFTGATTTAFRCPALRPNVSGFCGFSDRLLKMWWLKTACMYYLTVLEDRVLKLRCPQGCVPSGGSESESVSLPFLASGACHGLGSWRLLHLPVSLSPQLPSS